MLHVHVVTSPHVGVKLCICEAVATDESFDALIIRTRQLNKYHFRR